MAWIQFIVETSQDHAEECSEILMHAGAVAVSLEDAKDTPLFEPPPNAEPLWDNTRVIGLFESNADIVNIKKFLKHELQTSEFEKMELLPLEDKDWVAATNHAEAMCFGQKLWVVPSNQTDLIDSNATRIILDPGLAFGTGTHPTTALCLSWLAENPPEGKNVLDYGCGSGILGIAALKLKAKHVIAVDHDPQALFSTRSNALKNGFSEEQLETLLPKDMNQMKQEGLNKPPNKTSYQAPHQVSHQTAFDLILANILAEPLMELAPQFAAWTKPQGTLILSGILEKQFRQVIECYQPFFTDFETELSNEWVRIKAERL